MVERFMNRPDSVVVSQAITNAFLRGVYQWMGIGLAITAAVSWVVGTNEELLFKAAGLMFPLIIVQLGIVVALSWALHKLSGFAATALFIVYSAVTGVTLAPIFILYTHASIAQTFVASAGMFGAMSVYGLVTKRDLTSLGSFMFMGLIGIVIASIINLFLRSDAMTFVISIIGVIVFMGLTAFDTQKLRNMGLNAPADDPTALRRGTIFGALKLYLDFINLFIMLLRLFGNRR